MIKQPTERELTTPYTVIQVDNFHTQNSDCHSTIYMPQYFQNKLFSYQLGFPPNFQINDNISPAPHQQQFFGTDSNQIIFQPRHCQPVSPPCSSQSTSSPSYFKHLEPSNIPYQSYELFKYHEPVSPVPPTQPTLLPSLIQSDKYLDQFDDKLTLSNQFIFDQTAVEKGNAHGFQVTNFDWVIPPIVSHPQSQQQVALFPNNQNMFRQMDNCNFEYESSTIINPEIDYSLIATGSIIASTQVPEVSTTSSAPLKKNSKRKSPKPKIFNCTVCNKWFVSSNSLNKHYKTELHKNAVKSSSQDLGPTLTSAPSSKDEKQSFDISHEGPNGHFSYELRVMPSCQQNTTNILYNYTPTINLPIKQVYDQSFPEAHAMASVTPVAHNTHTEATNSQIYFNGSALYDSEANNTNTSSLWTAHDQLQYVTNNQGLTFAPRELPIKIDDKLPVITNDLDQFRSACRNNNNGPFRSFMCISPDTSEPLDHSLADFPNVQEECKENSIETNLYTANNNSDESEKKCNDCNRVFSRSCYLTQHKKTHHSGYKPFKCFRCGKRFLDEATHEEHISKHVGDKPHKCHICPKMFNYKTDLKRHHNWHSGRKLYACKICAKGFVRKDHMVKHIDSHKRKNDKLSARV